MRVCRQGHRPARHRPRRRARGDGRGRASSASRRRSPRSSPSAGAWSRASIEGRPVTAEELRDARRARPRSPRRCARSTTRPRAAGALRLVPSWSRDLPQETARARRRTPPDATTSAARGRGARSRRRSTGPEHAPVPCHNDLLTRELPRATASGVRIVDWEYAGMGDRYFDLGNLVGQQRLRRRRRGAAARGLLRRARRRRGAPARCG